METEFKIGDTYYINGKEWKLFAISDESLAHHSAKILNNHGYITMIKDDIVGRKIRGKLLFGRK